MSESDRVKFLKRTRESSGEDSDSGIDIDASGLWTVAIAGNMIRDGRVLAIMQSGNRSRE